MELIKANEGLMKMFKATKVEHCEAIKLQKIYIFS